MESIGVSYQPQLVQANSTPVRRRTWGLIITSKVKILLDKADLWFTVLGLCGKRKGGAARRGGNHPGADPAS
jgi:hypothetical protein